MDGRQVSPRRPRGPGIASQPSIAAEHGTGEPEAQHYAGSSRSSLFNLFRRQKLKGSSMAPQSAAGQQSVRSNGLDSYDGAFDNISLGTTVMGLESPQQAHEMSRKTEAMLRAATKYRKSLAAMSAAAAEFGNTLYGCSESKGAASGQTSLPDHSVDADLQAAAGLHLLISSHVEILASSFVANVEEPVSKEFELYKQKISSKEQEFKTMLRRKMAVLRTSDAQRQRDARKRRDLGLYRSSLLDLTYQIDDINRLKVEFLSDIHLHSVELAERMHAAMASTVTAEIEVAESIARKGWTGGGLDGLLAGCPDPFAEPEAEANGKASAQPAATSPAVDAQSVDSSSHFDESFDLAKPSVEPEHKESNDGRGGESIVESEERKGNGEADGVDKVDAGIEPAKVRSEALGTGPVEEPATEQATKATEQATEPTEPATEPTEPATEPTESATEPTESATEPTEAVRETEPKEAPEPTDLLQDTHLDDVLTREGAAEEGIKTSRDVLSLDSDDDDILATSPSQR